MPEQIPLFRDLPEYSGQVTKHPVYCVWQNIVQRCHNPNVPCFSNYGGRGIRVCDEWRKSSRAFVAWAIKAGYQPGLQLDRKNNNRGYNPRNCHFVTFRENINNRRNTLRLSDGTPLSYAAEASGLSAATVRRRVSHRGLSPDDAVSMPLVDLRKHFLSDGTSLSDAAFAAGLSIRTVRSRVYKYGWSPDDAASIPAGGKRPLPDAFQSVGDAAARVVAKAAGRVALDKGQGPSRRVVQGNEAQAPAIPRGLLDLPCPDLDRPAHDPGYPAEWLAKGKGHA